MGCPPTPLSLSLDTTIRPFLFASSNIPSTSPSSTTTTVSFNNFRPRSIPLRKFLSRFSSTSTSSPQPPTPAPLDSLPPTGTFVGPDDPRGLQTLHDFRVSVKLDRGGYLEIRQMQVGELDATALLLAESFAESMFGLTSASVPLLAFVVKQYVAERMLRAPHVVVLVGFYRERDDVEPAKLAATAEVSFDAIGANPSPPTPPPPPECPYICNMAVKKDLRRKRIGWHLLLACEELITKMGAERKVYLHCRMVDKAPFNMYKKADYKVVATDSFLVWLFCQRRKYLMSKELRDDPQL